MKTINKIWAAVLVLMMLVSMAAAEEMQVSAHNLLTLGDQQVVFDGKVVSACGEGWQYDAETGTLTLDGAVITGNKKNETGKSALYCDGSLNIVLNGENVIEQSGESTEGSFSGICVLETLNISGTGSLLVESGNAGQDSVGIFAIQGLSISGGRVNALSGSGSRSFGMVSTNEILIEGGSIVEAVGEEAAAISAGLFSGKGNVCIYDSHVTAVGGAAACDAASGKDSSAESAGIWAQGFVQLDASEVKAQGGAATHAGEGYAYSNGIYTGEGLNVDYGSKLEALGGTAEGGSAYSCGAYGNSNVQLYSAEASFTGGKATGENTAGSFGIQTRNAGVYVYESAGILAARAGSAEASAEDGAAYSNGIRAFVGDLAMDAGSAIISGGACLGALCDGSAVYAEAEVEESCATGGNITFAAPAHLELTAEEGYAAWAQIDLSVEEASERLPEGCSVLAVGEGQPWPDYCTLADAAGNALAAVTIASVGAADLDA